MKDKSTTTPRVAANFKTQRNYTPVIKKDTKLYHVLSELSQGKSLNMLEAVKKLSDYSLHTTISSIEYLGIHVQRKFEIVSSPYGNKTTRAKRYWLDELNQHKARKIVEAAL